MDKDNQKELQLLPPSNSLTSWLTLPRRPKPLGPPPELELKLSICSLSLEAPIPVEALRWQAAEEIRLASIEKAYAERVREMTRREIELAQSEFARARAMWDKAREEVNKAEKLREEANGCMGEREITCYSCRQRFRRPR